MAQEIASAYVTLLPSAKGMSKGIKSEMGGVFDDVEKQGTSSFGRVFKAAGVLALAAGTAIAGVFGASKIFGGGMARLMGIEEAQAKLRGLGNDTQAVEVIMGNALASVKGTSFGMAEAATVAASAVAAGIKPGEELERMLKTVSNSAAAAGTGMDEMGSIFNKVATTDMAQLDSLNQVADRGLPIFQALAEHFGVTTEEVRKMASAGKISFADFEAAMISASGTVAEEMGGTLRGSIENLNAALGRVGANFLEGVFPKFAPAIQALTGWLGGVEDAARVAGQRLGDWVDGAIEKFQAFSRGLSANMLGSDLANAWAIVGRSVRWNIIDPIREALDAWDAFKRGLSANMIGADIENSWAILGRSVRRFAGDITDAFTEAGGGLDGIRAAIETVIEDAADWLADGGVAKITGALSSMRAALTTAAVAAFGAIAAALPQVLPEIVGAVTGIIIPGIVGSIELLLPELVLAFTTMLPAVVAAAVALVEGIVGAIEVSLPIILDSLTELVPILISALVEMIPAVVDAAVMLFLGIVDGLATALPLIIAAIGDAAPLLVEGIVAALPTIIEGAITLFLGLIDGLTAALPEIITAITDAIPKIVEALVAAAPVLIAGAVELFSAIAEGLDGAMPVIATAVMDLVDEILRIIFTGDYYEAGMAILTALGEGIVGGAPSVHSIMMNFGREITERIFSWESGFGEAAWAWIASLLSGLTSSWPSVRTWLEGVGAAVDTAIGNAKSFLLDKGRDVITGFQDGIGEIWPSVVSWVKDIPTKLSAAMGDLSSTFKGAGASLIGGLAAGIREGFRKAREAVSSGLAGLRAYFPFSPAKIGPFSGAGYTTHAGRALMRDFASAIAGERDTTRRALESALGMGFPSLALQLPTAAAGSTQAPLQVTVNAPRDSFRDINHFMSLMADLEARSRRPR